MTGVCPDGWNRSVGIRQVAAVKTPAYLRAERVDCATTVNEELAAGVDNEARLTGQRQFQAAGTMRLQSLVFRPGESDAGECAATGTVTPRTTPGIIQWVIEQNPVAFFPCAPVEHDALRIDSESEWQR